MSLAFYLCNLLYWPIHQKRNHVCKHSTYIFVLKDLQDPVSICSPIKSELVDYTKMRSHDIDCINAMWWNVTVVCCRGIVFKCAFWSLHRCILLSMWWSLQGQRQIESHSKELHCNTEVKWKIILSAESPAFPNYFTVLPQ